MIALVVPIVNMNVFQLYGGSNKLAMPRVKKNVISFYQPTASIVKTLPRDISNIGAINIRMRSRRQAGKSFPSSIYGRTKSIRPREVIVALSCLCGTMPQMTDKAPLHPDYRDVSLNDDFEESGQVQSGFIETVSSFHGDLSVHINIVALLLYSQQLKNI